MISIYQVNKNFGKLHALSGVSLELKGGKSYALIGPNGSGKTTLIKSILGMVVPTSGEIIFDGKSIRNDWKYREKIGYMPQIGRYPDNMRIGQLIDMMQNIRTADIPMDEELIDAFKLYKIYDKRMHAMSGGTRQKVSAALAFLFKPPVLILDEPTAGLDPVSVEVLKEKIIREKQAGKLLLISSHILSDLDELSTEVVYIFEGKVQYNNSIESLKEETGEKRLGKAIACMINQKELLASVSE
ncbi:MAG: ABC transporter ATP-binding protein [Cyclobacteriaceae bacterium]|nr:ABC transporter ATP-binding protein [Cyclobacteriaceae bacterium]